MDIEKLPVFGKKIKERRARALISPPGGRSWPAVSQSGQVGDGRIHIVVNKGDAGKPVVESLLSDDDKLVLSNNDGKSGLELKGQSRYGQDAAAEHEGIYISKSDYDKYSWGTNVAARRYTGTDTFRKARKSKALAGTAIVALAAALSGAGNAFLATPSGVASTQTPQNIVAAWADEPTTLLQAPNLSPAQIDKVHQLVESRIAVGAQCLKARDGQTSAPAEPIPGVDCQKPKIYKTTHFWGLITAFLAIATGIFGLVAWFKKLGFQGA
ncbi:hypothetical protein [Mycobacterium sp. SMC-17]|uniref:hypothetical protein n=1 Tax=Mycobacterium sp. SMC-17 TaxID=3381628 RepID=UPI003876CA54